MRLMTTLRTIMTAAFAVAAMTGTAMADIRVFNDAMQAKDYKKAAAEAASSWQEFDKSRSDISAIAREFGMAAYLAGDFAAARAYGETAVKSGSAEGRPERIGSDVLFRMADLQVSPSMDSRDKLLTALQASATLSGIDLISYLGAGALVTFDTDRGYWKFTRTSAALAEKLTAQGGPGYTSASLQYGLLRSMAQFADDRNVEGYGALTDLQSRVVEAINRAPSGKSAESLVQIYWDSVAWRTSANSMLEQNAKGKLKDYQTRMKPVPEIDRMTPGGQVVFPPHPTNVCKTQLSGSSPRPTFPGMASMNGMMGTVILDVALDADGKVVSAEILSAAPEKYFGDYTVKAAKKFMFEQREGEAAGCTLAQTGMVFTFVFSLRS